MKVRDVIRLIEKAGWTYRRTRDDHRVYVHPVRAGIVVGPGHPGSDVAPGTLSSILKQAGVK